MTTIAADCPSSSEPLIIRQARQRALRTPLPSAPPTNSVLNPSLEIVPHPDADRGFTLCWRRPGDNTVLCRRATDTDLLAIKLVAEGLSPAEVARQSNVSLVSITTCLWQAVRDGLLLAPQSRLRRNPARFDPEGRHLESQLVADSFTLQWHITQACDLHCRHCYDRSHRSAVSLKDGLRILDQLQAFCAERWVSGQVSFTGGNPFLHPNFIDFYREAADCGLQAAILGNPVPARELEAVLAISRPVYFQVSLEGLAAHNDAIRGPGHFQRTVDFLTLLRSLGVRSQVMLTLTGDNIDQVIPLGHQLQGLADSLAFNRLALFGEGAQLSLPDKVKFITFLDNYRLATRELSVLALKDNLLNCAYAAAGEEPFCGCAGHGCGAAFNFVSLLADGEVHACRKLPSPIGSIHRQTLAAIYDSPVASRYRDGSSACSDCELRAVCGGCLAITASFGQDPLAERDPFCPRPPANR